MAEGGVLGRASPIVGEGLGCGSCPPLCWSSLSCHRPSPLSPLAPTLPPLPLSCPFCCHRCRLVLVLALVVLVLPLLVVPALSVLSSRHRSPVFVSSLVSRLPSPRRFHPASSRSRLWLGVLWCWSLSVLVSLSLSCRLSILIVPLSSPSRCCAPSLSPAPPHSKAL
ncbi:hypothetical protein F5148DRAFT_1206601 [Russula earlei]|uniref:Uncharacterized protein n=1 Tax=Russula earlei TaxID=71964 RepID=A0ACC0U767_9AGAM|nr:hypothetical protein F5148DRAFT_1206601 [Russula earlei]